MASSALRQSTEIYTKQLTLAVFVFQEPNFYTNSLAGHLE